MISHVLRFFITSFWWFFGLRSFANWSTDSSFYGDRFLRRFNKHGFRMCMRRLSMYFWLIFYLMRLWFFFIEQIFLAWIILLKNWSIIIFFPNNILLFLLIDDFHSVRVCAESSSKHLTYFLKVICTIFISLLHSELYN